MTCGETNRALHMPLHVYRTEYNFVQQTLLCKLPPVFKDHIVLMFLEKEHAFQQNWFLITLELTMSGETFYGQANCMLFQDSFKQQPKIMAALGRDGLLQRNAPLRDTRGPLYTCISCVS